MARALTVRRRDVFQVAHVDMAFRRMQAPALYRREPLETLIYSLVGDVTFRDLSTRLLVNTTDLLSGMQVMWGLPGLLDARVADAVAASCALPGLFPPQTIQGRAYVDGAVVENLPVRLAASLSPNPIIAVNVAATSVRRAAHETEGFAATYIRGLEIVMQTQIEGQLRDWKGPPLVLVQPAGGAHLDVRLRQDRGADRGGLPGHGARRSTRLGNHLHRIPSGNASDASASGHGGRRALCGVRRLRDPGADGVRAQLAGVRPKCSFRSRAGRRWMVPTSLNCPTDAISVGPVESAA